MNHAVRRTLLALLGGVAVQRLCQLTAFVLVGRSLGVDGLGVYAQALALAAVLGVVAGAGIGNAAARAVAAAPQFAGAILAATMRMRLRRGLALAGIAATAAALATDAPWLWILCALQCVPAAFDQKAAFDACGRTGVDVRLESLAAILQLAATAALAASGLADATAFAAVALAVRCVHALGAARALAALPGHDASAPRLPAHQAGLAIGQSAHELLAIGDVCLVALALGDAAAGLYALGARFASAALVPSIQLARLLLPHHLHAAGNGDRGRTLATALRATALATVPMAAGGAAVADGLCALSGDAFVAAAPTLRLLLLAGCAQHLGWQFSQALLASHRDAAYGHAFAWPAVAHAAAIGLLPLAGPLAAGAGAAAAAGVALAAQAGYAACAGALLRPRPRLRLADVLDTAAVAAATAATAAGILLAAPAGTATTTLPLQLLAGGATFAVMLWRVEFRGRLGRLGDGLAAASSLRR